MTPHSNPAEVLVSSATRFLFFTGKGGVGKTSLACATAVLLADHGKRVLLASTDPASNLDEVFGTALVGTARPIPGAPNLHALNIDPEAAAREYRERIVGPLRGKLPEAALRSVEEQLSGACTLEIASFDEFSKLLGDPESIADYDHVIFDTAPTGHTLRLLALPKAWAGFFESNTSGASCLGPLAGLQKQRSLYEASLKALGDSDRTKIVLASRPQLAPLREAQRTSEELSALGINNFLVVLNGRFHARSVEDPVARAFQARGDAAVAQMNEFLKSAQVVEVPLSANNVLGLDALRDLLQPVRSAGFAGSSRNNSIHDEFQESQKTPGTETLDELVDRLAAGAGRGVIMTMGKGGVGKTTIAAAVAAELARRGHQVHLSTTDPAAHIEAAAANIPGLSLSRIDPAIETRSYVEHVLETTGRSLDAHSRAVLKEELRSPCTEEIAVFRAFARVVAKGMDGFVVLDTAPTGHTLLLLDATEAYHREVARRSSELPEEVRNVLPRLRDPEFTRVLIVSLPEATPVHEAAALQDDLRRAGIEPFAWVINQSLLLSGTSDPILKARAGNEQRYIREVTEGLSAHTALVAWVPEEPAGPHGLEQLFQFERTKD